MYHRILAIVLISGLFGYASPPLVQASELSMEALRAPVFVDRPVTFEARTGDGVSSENLVNEARWDFGDGGSSVGRCVQYTFRKPGIYPIRISTNKEHPQRRLAAIIRVRTSDVKPTPKVLLDSDARCEADDQHFIAYALFSEVDVLGVSSVHNGDGTESINYGEIHYIFRLAKRSGFPVENLPMAFHGADTRLRIPESGKWQDTEPIVTEASEAVLAAARGASPESQVWVLPVGAGTNVASAILQAHREGLDLKTRIRIIWLGGHAQDYHKEHNGHYDPWSVYVMGQSGINMQILLSHPTSLKLNIDKRVEAGLYPDNELGKYLLQITPLFQWRSTKPKALHDACVLATVINEHLGRDWVTETEPTYVTGPEQDYSWQPADENSTVRLIRDIDGEAMKADLFNTLNGNPSHIRKDAQPRARD